MRFQCKKFILPSIKNTKLIARLYHAVWPWLDRIPACKIMPGNSSTRFSFQARKNKLISGRQISMVCVYVNPVEILVGKTTHDVRTFSYVQLHRTTRYLVGKFLFN